MTPNSPHPSEGASGVSGVSGVAHTSEAPGGIVGTLQKIPVLHRPRREHASNKTHTLLIFGAAALLLIAIVASGRAAGELALLTDFTQKNLGPGLEHWFGTDWMGRDMFLRTLAGLSLSVLVGLVAAGASALIALLLGTAAALGGRKLDTAITWLIDLMLGIPHIVLLVLISFALGKGFWGITIGVAVTHWPTLARVIRAEILQVKQAPYIEVARKLGRSRLSLALRHMLPFVFPQFLVGLVLLFPHAILHEAALTFLGFGLSPEAPAIGIILSESMSYLSAGYWWLAVFPGVALVATVLLFDLAGSSLRKLIDPHTSQE
ncbi:MAG: ABC transporter permease [Coriobacteriales bacterium]|jgi:peptide/nickel transport system permease protein|nr:ABC transporter permease [Coriobacteriales bacterium]